MTRSVVLFSGGIDSTVCAVKRIKNGTPPMLLTFDYGQSNPIELDYARTFAFSYGLPIRVVKLPTINKTGSPIYPGRNLLFVAAALPVAVENNAAEIIIGCNQTDFEDFPDCRDEFFANLNRTIHSAGYAVRVSTPLLYKSKTEVVAEAIEMGIAINKTWSCYSPANGSECGSCDACKYKGQAIANNA